MRVLVLSLVLFASIEAKEPFFLSFTPPRGWQLSHPSTLEEEIKVAFVQSKRSIFSPAISISVERIGHVALDEYLKALECIHAKNPRNHYRELGCLTGRSGPIHILQIDTVNRCGEIRVLQAIALRDGCAVIQTATARKKEFPAVRDQLLQSFQSLAFWPDLFASLGELEKGEECKGALEELAERWEGCLTSSLGEVQCAFQSAYFQEEHWKPFVRYFTETFREQGPCWQFLAIAAIKEHLLEDLS